MALDFQSPCLLSSCSFWRALNQSAAWSSSAACPRAAGHYSAAAPRTPRSLSHATRPGPPRRPRPAPHDPSLPTRSGDHVPGARRAPITEMLLSATTQSHNQRTFFLSPMTSTSAEVGRRRGPEVCKQAGLKWYCSGFGFAWVCGCWELLKFRKANANIYWLSWEEQVGKKGMFEL